MAEVSKASGFHPELDASGGLKARIFHEQVRALYSRGGLALVTNVVNGSVLVVALWSAISRPVGLAWLTLVYAVVIIRLGVWHRFRSVDRSAEDSARWARYWVIGTAFTGALWGLSGVVLVSPDRLSAEYLVLFVIGGMIAGASASMSTFFPAFLAFAAPALALPILRLLHEMSREHLAAGLFLLVFGVAMALLARSSERLFVESVRLRYRNVLLVEDLSRLRVELTQLGRELEQRVMSRTGELEQELTDKDRLISIVSHELKSPLTTIKLNEQILSRVGRSGDGQALNRICGVLSRQTDRMRRLLDDLLDMSRLSAERIGYTMAPVELRVVVDDMLEEMASQLSAAGVTLSIHLEPGLKGTWDRSRIQQVLVNLISNALKYGREPFSIAARSVNQRAQIIVKDSGPGIPAEHLERIFAPHERAVSLSTASGHGLGLYIARCIVRAHGGTIRAENLEPGAAFIVELPLLGQPPVGEAGSPSESSAQQLAGPAGFGCARPPR